MECWNITRGLPAYLDGFGSEEERRAIARHLSGCSECAETVGQYQAMRRAVSSLPKQVPGAHLNTALRVIASRECARRQTRLSVAHIFTAWKERTWLLLNNMMRPLALPVAGGVLSAVVLFGMLVPDFTIEVHPVAHDIPTVLFTEASVKDAAPISISESELIVDMTVDENGKMTDYSIVHGGNLLTDPGVRRRFEYAMLFTSFTPATAFGQPTAGKIRVSFRTSKIDVRG